MLSSKYAPAWEPKYVVLATEFIQARGKLEFTKQSSSDFY